MNCTGTMVTHRESTFSEQLNRLRSGTSLTLNWNSQNPSFLSDQHRQALIRVQQATKELQVALSRLANIQETPTGHVTDDWVATIANKSCEAIDQLRTTTGLIKVNLTHVARLHTWAIILSEYIFPTPGFSEDTTPQYSSTPEEY